MGLLLLTKVNFKIEDTYGEILQRYLNTAQIYLICDAVFGGYNDNTPSTKYVTQLKRSAACHPTYLDDYMLTISSFVGISFPSSVWLAELVY